MDQMTDEPRRLNLNPEPLHVGKRTLVTGSKGITREQRRNAWIALDGDPAVWDEEHPLPEPDHSFVWAVCPGCHETWTDDTDESKEWVIADVVDECRAHLTAHPDHSPTFDVGIGPLSTPESAESSDA